MTFTQNINAFHHECTVNKKYSQLGQDIFVLLTLNFKKNGYFVDFGATDGIQINNTYLLETQYEWNGIVCEPSINYYSALSSNRKCHIENKCVYKKSGELVEFMDCDARELSTIVGYDNDKWSWNRVKNITYKVETISLDDLLDKYNAPETIDYISIDTEGSELNILEAFSFNRNISIITVEHNHTDKREKIFDLLNSKNFTRVYKDISDFDDWYINNKLM